MSLTFPPPQERLKVHKRLSALPWIVLASPVVDGKAVWLKEEILQGSVVCLVVSSKSFHHCQALFFDSCIPHLEQDVPRYHQSDNTIVLHLRHQSVT